LLIGVSQLIIYLNLNKYNTEHVINVAAKQRYTALKIDKQVNSMFNGILDTVGLKNNIIELRKVHRGLSFGDSTFRLYSNTNVKVYDALFSLDNVLQHITGNALSLSNPYVNNKDSVFAVFKINEANFLPKMETAVNELIADAKQKKKNYFNIQIAVNLLLLLSFYLQYQFIIYPKILKNKRTEEIMDISKAMAHITNEDKRKNDISRKLHDEINPLILSAILKIKSIDTTSAKEVDHIAKTLRSAVSSLNRISQENNLHDFKDFTIKESIELVLHSINHPDVVLDFNEEPLQMEDTYKVLSLNLIQEFIGVLQTNIAVHCRRISIYKNYENYYIELAYPSDPEVLQDIHNEISKSQIYNKLTFFKGSLSSKLLSEDNYVFEIRIPNLKEMYVEAMQS
jgi:hypothetical protein